MNFLNSRFTFSPASQINLRLQGPDDDRQRRLDIGGRIHIDNVGQADQVDILFARLLFSEQTALVADAKPRGHRISFNRQDLYVSISGSPIDCASDANVDLLLESAEVKVKKLAPADGDDAKAYIHVTLTADAQKLTPREIFLLLECLDNEWTMFPVESAHQGDPEKSAERKEQEKLEKRGQQTLLKKTTVTVDLVKPPHVAEA